MRRLNGFEKCAEWEELRTIIKFLSYSAYNSNTDILVCPVFPVHQHLRLVEYFAGESVVRFGVGRDADVVAGRLQGIPQDGVDAVGVDGGDVVFRSLLSVPVLDGNRHHTHRFRRHHAKAIEPHHRHVGAQPLDAAAVALRRPRLLGQLFPALDAGLRDVAVL